jgi:O-antigen ligase
MKTEVAAGGAYYLTEKQQRVFTFLCMGIVISLIYWPLLNSILAILTFAYWLFFLKKNFRINSVRGYMFVIFALTYLPIAIGYLNSANNEEALFRMQQKIPLLIFPVILGTIAFHYDKFLRQILWCLSLATVSGCIVCLVHGVYVYFALGSTGSLNGYQLIVLKDMQPHVLALCCFLSIVFHLQNIFSSKGQAFRKTNMLQWAVIIFLSLFIILLSNRMILICWSITILYFLYQLISSLAGRLLLTTGFIILLVGAVIFNPALNSQWNDLIDFSEENSIQLDQDKSLGRGWGGKTVRLTIWKCSFDVVKEHWLLGVGTGDTQDELQKAYEKRKFYFASMYNRYNAHNQYIQNLLMNGILALFIFLAALLYPVFISINKRVGIHIYTIFLLAIMLIFCTESFLEINKGIVFYSFFNSIFAFSLLKQNRNPINSLS